MTEIKIDEVAAPKMRPILDGLLKLYTISGVIRALVVIAREKQAGFYANKLDTPGLVWEKRADALEKLLALDVF